MPIDAVIRLVIFVLVLLSILLWQALKPRRVAGAHTRQRWFQHLSLSALNTLAAKLILPMGLSGLALWVETKQWGVLQQFEWHFALKLVISLVLLDLLIFEEVNNRSSLLN